MQDILDQTAAILRGVWRRRWLALAVAAVVCLVSWAVILTMPDRYEASARVFVDPSTALKPVIQGLAIEQDMNAELNLVRQTLMSRPHLQKILQETGLAPKVASPVALERATDALGDRIEIVSAAPVGTDGQPMPSKVYTISYRDSNRDRSIKVVSILLDSFMEGTIGGKRNNSLAAQQFVERQIKDYETRLSAAEESLAEFKKRNVGMVPEPGEQQSDYFSRLQNEIDAVKKTQTSLGIAETRRAALARQLRGEGPLAAGPTLSAIPGPNGTLQPGGDTLSRIQETQAKLDDMLLRFTEKHPDVIALRQTLVDLKERRQREIEALSRGEAGAAAATGASANPIYQSIQLALNQTDVEIAGLKGELSDHQQKVTELRRMVDTMPQVEAEYARLNRDYNVNKAQYTALVERLEKARLGEEAEAKGSIRFEVIDPPTAAFRPVSPQRTILIVAALIVAIAAGGGVAYIMTTLNPVFDGARQLAEVTGAAVLGVVSMSRDAGSAGAHKRQYVVYSLACCALFVALVAAVLVGRLYSPLSFGPHS
jgi:polysaccharide chain length determinant protein (PEP-CTERM system associated)